MSGLIFLTSSVFAVARSIYERINMDKPKLAFISTAAEAEEGDLLWLEDSRNSLVEAGFEVADYTITGKSREQIEADLEPFDVLFFSGGNQFYLLQKVKESNCAGLIRDFVSAGKVYIGESAGSELAGKDLYSTYHEDDIRKAPDLKNFDGLSLVDFIVFPHWGSVYFRNKYLGQRMEHAYTENDKIILLTDFQYIIVENGYYRIIEVEHSSQ